MREEYDFDRIDDEPKYGLNHTFQFQGYIYRYTEIEPNKYKWVPTDRPMTLREFITGIKEEDWKGETE